MKSKKKVKSKATKTQTKKATNVSTSKKSKAYTKTKRKDKSPKIKKAPSLVLERFRVYDMTCSSCERIVSRTVKKKAGVTDFHVDFVTGMAMVEYNPKKADIDDILDAIEDKGYGCEFLLEEPANDGKIRINITKIKNSAKMLGFLFLAFTAYSLLSEHFESYMPVMGQDASIMLLFIIGLFTGFHCIAMCGGFVVSYSAKSGDKIDYMSHLTYGVAKTASYAFFGAVFGLIGSFFTFTPLIRGFAGVFAGLFLVGFGMNMLNMLTFLKKYRLKTPSFVNIFLNQNSKNKGPAAIGLMNGLMIACGPLQAIYLMAAASGSAYYGAIYLLAFGLGTLPVLLGFGVVTSHLSSKFTHKIMRYSGALVIILGVIMINRGVALTGTGYDLNTLAATYPSLDVSAESDAPVAKIELSDDGFQEIKMEVVRYGWKPDKFVLKKGVPVKWIIEGKEINGCNNAIQVPQLGLKFDIKKGTQTIEFTPQEEGVIPFSCWMGMIPGVFIVKDDIDIDNPQEILKELEEVEVPQGGSCGGGGGCGCGGGR